MFRLKMSSLWFWGLIITFEILLISLVGYTLVSYQAYNNIANQLKLDAMGVQKGKAKSNYLVIDRQGQIQQGSTPLKKPIPSSFKNPTSLPNQSLLYDDLYAYRLQSLSQSNDYLITYQPYKENNPWPERIVITSGVLVILAILLISLYHLLNNSTEASFVIS